MNSLDHLQLHCDPHWEFQVQIWRQRVRRLTLFGFSIFTLKSLFLCWRLLDIRLGLLIWKCGKVIWFQIFSMKCCKFLGPGNCAVSGWWNGKTHWCERLCFATSHSCMILEKSFIPLGLHFMKILMMVMAVEENSYRTVTEACARLLTSNILQEKPKWTFWPTQYYLQQLYGGGNIIPILQMSKLRFKDNSSACWRPYKYQSKCQSQVQTQGYLAKKISDPHHSLPMFFLLGKWRDLVRGPQRML